MAQKLVIRIEDPLPDHALVVVTARPRCTECGDLVLPGHVLIAQADGPLHQSCALATGRLTSWAQPGQTDADLGLPILRVISGG